MLNYLNIRIKQKYDTIANWSANNPILLEGEIGFATDGEYTGQYKIGDGVKHWNELEFSFNEVNKFSKKLGDIVIVNAEITLNEEEHCDRILLVTDPCTINIPQIENGFNCIIKNIQDEPISLIPVSCNVDGSTATLKLRKYEFIRIVQHDDDFYIVDSNVLNGIKVGDYTIETVGSLLSNDKLD